MPSGSEQKVTKDNMFGYQIHVFESSDEDPNSENRIREVQELTAYILTLARRKGRPVSKQNHEVDNAA